MRTRIKKKVSINSDRALATAFAERKDIPFKQALEIVIAYNSLVPKDKVITLKDRMYNALDKMYQEYKLKTT